MLNGWGRSIMMVITVGEGVGGKTTKQKSESYWELFVVSSQECKVVFYLVFPKVLLLEWPAMLKMVYLVVFVLVLFVLGLVKVVDKPGGIHDLDHIYINCLF